MKEGHRIVERWRRGDGAVLATLFRVQGSSYRQPGARLLVCQDGSYEGSISGGCLEADLVRKAAWLVREGETIERYSTLFDAASEIPFGLGCGGVLDVLLEPIVKVEAQALLAAMEDQGRGHERLVATWLPTATAGLMRAVFDKRRRLLFTSAQLSEEQILQAEHVSISGDLLESRGMVFERLRPPQRLFVFGAGDDVKPLVTMASLLGWEITVCDGRRQLARPDRFPVPSPGRHVRVSPAREEILREVEDRDAVVIMTHSFEQDRDCLISLLPQQPKYLGLLGSRQRSALLIGEAAARLGYSVEECCQFISAPVGLDIGGEGPEVIALAILAEAQATCSGKARSREKLSARHIENYIADLGPKEIASAQCALKTI